METWPSNLTLEPWQKFALAALIGLLVGLEREHAQQERETAHFAGIRTFPMITLLGCTTAMLAAENQIWLFAVGFAGMVALILAVYAFSAQRGDLGATTEVVALLVYLIGGLVYWDQAWLADPLELLYHKKGFCPSVNRSQPSFHCRSMSSRILRFSNPR